MKKKLNKILSRQNGGVHFPLNVMKKINSAIFLTLFFLSVALSSCHKSPGAICNDGHRSYSTGRGTCSWHGGVHHYIDTNEISIPKTAGLVIVLIFVGGIFVAGQKKDK